MYLLNNGSDLMGGPVLTSLGGTFGINAYGQTGYAFDAGQGLSVSGVVDAAVYTIDFAFAFDQLSGYRRLVDFKNQTSDTGLYNRSSSLNFYNVTTGPAVFTAQELARVTITRDASGLFTGYVNGVQQISFADTGNLAQFDGPAQIRYFFRDDNAVGGENSSGFADYIQFFDVALSASEVAALTSPVPEPGTWVMMLGGLLALSRLRPASASRSH